MARTGRSGPQLVNAAAMTALRSARWTNVEHGTGERELYDVRRRSYQLRQRTEAADPAVLKALSARLLHLANRAAESRRSLEALQSASF
jgi:N-acetylglucosamine-6-sulfatase